MDIHRNLSNSTEIHRCPWKCIDINQIYLTPSESIGVDGLHENLLKPFEYVCICGNPIVTLLMLRVLRLAVSVKS